jgi:EAL domain-containing protein (putative c-di-GMP-specific phosphodiesterase class I)
LIPLNEIHASLAGFMIETRYQPIVRLADRKPVAVEVLARMNHPIRGTLLPHLFVPQMEDAGLAPALTEAVTRRAFADMTNPSLLPHGLEIALNFPLDVLLVPQAMVLLDAQRRIAGIEAKQIIIELTESRPVEDVVGLRHAIERLRAAGYGVVIDDIQPEVPQLQALLELPFTGVKLDKDLVLLLANDAGLRNFILDIVGVAKSRGLTVTAEGVEDSASWYRLAGLGVDMAQGFLIARPLLAVAVPVWLRRWSKRQSFA